MVWPSPHYTLRENSGLAQADLSCYCSSSMQAVYHRENKTPVRQDQLVRTKASSLSLKSSGVEESLEGWASLIWCGFAILAGLHMNFKVNTLLKIFLVAEIKRGQKKKSSVKEEGFKVLRLF